ncbi:MAG: formimidoylglutamate deiminase, partial [Alphaproteobacteria bacterium]|nr:formimidoylglutamate deiminase [Alphaproteobacteria bacterium]
IAIDGGTIMSVESDATPRPADRRAGVGLPAPANLHSHAFQRGMAGLAEVRGPAADNFWTWREVMYRFLGAMTPDDVEAVTAYAYVEMLETGFGRVGEFHYLHHDPDGRPYARRGEMAERIVAAASTAGIGLTLLPVFYAHASFGGLPPTAGQRRFISDLDGFAELVAQSRVAGSALRGFSLGVAPHSLRAATPGELSVVAVMAGVGPIHMHIAEQTKEVEDCVAWSGLRPVEWLLRNAPVDSRWCLIHATHMSEAETAGLAATGAVAGLCPVTEANLGDGIFNGAAWIALGGAFGVGTDSNINIGLAAELRQFEYAQRLRHRARNVIADREGMSTGRSLFDRSLAGGAAALGAPVSALAAGAPADIVALDADHPSIAGRHGDALLDGWIFGSDRGLVTSVWNRGAEVVANGRHVRREPIEGAYRRTIRRLLAL